MRDILKPVMVRIHPEGYLFIALFAIATFVLTLLWDGFLVPGAVWSFPWYVVKWLIQQMERAREKIRSENSLQCTEDVQKMYSSTSLLFGLPSVIKYLRLSVKVGRKGLFFCSSGIPHLGQAWPFLLLAISKQQWLQKISVDFCLARWQKIW